LGSDRPMGEERRTDAQLLAAARTDADAFHAIYQRYAQRTFVFFERRTHNREASFELTAETFARAWLSRRTFRDLAGGSVGPWLFAIARRVLIASVEKHRLEFEARERLGVLSKREPVEAEPEPGWLDDLSDAMESLPPSQRQAVQLRVVHELSYQQLAASLGCSQTAARIRVSRGLSALRNVMGGEAR